MGLSFLVRAALVASACAVFLPACDKHCGLGERDHVVVTNVIPCCGVATFLDVPLRGETSDAEFSLANTAMPAQPGAVDAFLVPTSCQKLFDGPYPGGAPLCAIHVGPVKPGGVSSRVKLAPGTYRVYVQGYSNATDTARFLVDVFIWDYSCRPLIQ